MFSDKNIISVTDKAAERVKYLINKGDENVKGLRIGVKSSCLLYTSPSPRD